MDAVNSEKILNHLINLSNQLMLSLDSYINLEMTEDERVLITQSSVLASELLKRLETVKRYNSDLNCDKED